MLSNIDYDNDYHEDDNDGFDDDGFDDDDDDDDDGIDVDVDDRILKKVCIGIVYLICRSK